MNDKKVNKTAKTKKKPAKKKTQAVEKRKPEGIIGISEASIKKFICPTASNEEIKLFINQCVMWQLNPFKREIYLVKYSGQPAHNIIAFMAFLKRAERTKMLAGWKAWTEGSPKTKEEFKACLAIYRKGWDEPFYHEVFWEEYKQTRKDGQLTKFWKDKPITMLKKVVISQGFRMCFPDELSGIPYSAEEMPIEVEKLPEDEIKEGEVIHEAEIVEEENPREKAKPKAPPAEAPSTPGITIEDVVAEVQNDLKIYFGKDYKKKYPRFKRFLQDLGKEKGRKFVAVNEHQKLSLNLGELEDLKKISLNMGWVREKYIEWEKEYGETIDKEEGSFQGSEGEDPFE